MLLPLLLTRMKERRLHPCVGVQGLCPRALKFIAAITSEAEILKSGGPSSGQGKNVVYDHRDADEHRAAAVRTPLALSFYDLPAQGGRKPRTPSHYLSTTGQGMASPLEQRKGIGAPGDVAISDGSQGRQLRAFFFGQRPLLRCVQQALMTTPL
jgi:hypothetical protein